MNKTWEKKQILDPTLAFLTQIWAHKTFLEVLPLLVVRHCSNQSSNAI